MVIIAEAVSLVYAPVALVGSAVMRDTYWSEWARDETAYITEILTISIPLALLGIIAPTIRQQLLDADT